MQKITKVVSNIRRRVNAWQPEHWFAALAIVFGGLFLLLTPPQKGPDEWAHFFRAYQVSDGRILATRNQDGSYGGMLPKSLSTTNVLLTGDNVLHYYDNKYRLFETKQALHLPLRPHDQIEVNFTGSALYSPVPYLGAALAIEPGKLLNLPPVVLIYLARLGCLAGWVLLVFWAIRLAPFGKWAMVALALIPVSLFQASVVSADGATNGLAFLLVGYTLKLWLGKEKIARSQLFIYGGILTLLALAKPTYAILALLVLLIPNQKFGSLPAALVRKGLLGGVALAVALAWGLIVQPATTYALAHFPDPTVTVNQGRQLGIVEANPGGYLALVFDNIFTTTADPLYLSAVGVLGSYDVPLPVWVSFWAGLVIAVTLLSEGFRLRDPRENALLKKLFIVALILANVVLVLTALYTAFTPLGWGIIYGLQGRYVLAVTALLVPLALVREPLLKVDPRRLQHFVVGSYATILVATVITVYLRYYFDGRLLLLGS